MRLYPCCTMASKWRNALRSPPKRTPAVYRLLPIGTRGISDGAGAFSYVESGTLKLDRRLEHQGRLPFSLSHYQGVTYCAAAASAWGGYCAAVTTDSCLKSQKRGAIEAVPLTDRPDFYKG